MTKLPLHAVRDLSDHAGRQMQGALFRAILLVEEPSQRAEIAEEAIFAILPLLAAARLAVGCNRGRDPTVMVIETLEKLTERARALLHERGHELTAAIDAIDRGRRL